MGVAALTDEWMLTLVDVANSVCETSVIGSHVFTF